MGYRVFAVIAPRGALEEEVTQAFESPRPLEQGFALQAVNTDMIADEQLALPDDDFSYLTESALGYVLQVSRRARVVYIEADFFGGRGRQTAGCWTEGRVALGPVTSSHARPPGRGRQLYDRGAVDTALEWLGVTRDGGNDEFDAIGLGDVGRLC